MLRVKKRWRVYFEQEVKRGVLLQRMWRLYVAMDDTTDKEFNFGSNVCLEIIRTTNLNFVRVENLTVILNEKKAVPDWLDGSPTLVETERKRVFYGSSARDKLLELAQMHAEEENNKQGSVAEARGGGETGVAVRDSQEQNFLAAEGGDADDEADDSLDLENIQYGVKDTPLKLDEKSLEKMFQERIRKIASLAETTKQ